MSDLNASFLERLYEMAGAALELCSSTGDEDERAYWMGRADTCIELISVCQDLPFKEVKKQILEAYDWLSLADRVNEMFG